MPPAYHSILLEEFSVINFPLISSLSKKIFGGATRSLANPPIIVTKLMDYSG